MNEKTKDRLFDPVAAGIVLPPVLTLDDVRKVLRLRSRRAVHGLRRREALPMSRVGRQWIITRQRFQEWIDGLAERAAPLLNLRAVESDTSGAHADGGGER